MNENENLRSWLINNLKLAGQRKGLNGKEKGMIGKEQAAPG